MQSQKEYDQKSVKKLILKQSANNHGGSENRGSAKIISSSSREFRHNSSF